MQEIDALGMNLSQCFEAIEEPLCMGVKEAKGSYKKVVERLLTVRKVPLPHLSCGRAGVAQSYHVFLACSRPPIPPWHLGKSQSSEGAHMLAECPKVLHSRQAVPKASPHCWWELQQ